MREFFEAPKSAPALSIEMREKGMEIYERLKVERQEIANDLADLYDEADELGIDLENAYDPKDEAQPSRIVVREDMLADRARIGLWLEKNEEVMVELEQKLGITRPHDA